MIDDAEFDRLVREAARSLRTPSSVQVEQEWLALAARRRRRAWRRISWGYGGAVAAALALGVWLGRWSAPVIPGLSPATRGATSWTLSRLEAIDRVGTDTTVLRTLVDTTVPIAERHALLYAIREGRRHEPSIAALRELFDQLPTTGTMQITLIEIVAGAGGATNAEWIRGIATRESLPARTRVAALQQLGQQNRVTDLEALFATTEVQLVRFAILEQLRSRSGPDASAALRRIREALPDGVLRDAAVAAFEAQAPPP
jgi:hypothetical protein